MSKTKTKPAAIGEGWSVHVYDSDRHLRFTLEPSHVWVFIWGIGVGLLIAIMWSTLHSASHSAATKTDQSNFLPATETSSEESVPATPTHSFPVGID